MARRCGSVTYEFRKSVFKIGETCHANLRMQWVRTWLVKLVSL
ncbi:hypothetical protein HanRHA438_Chr09g0422131 [Helianthus annuus]|nr:hypothetical protein HanRHA438_Chr09g0422131 [Helianthus annuus]